MKYNSTFMMEVKIVKKIVGLLLSVLLILSQVTVAFAQEQDINEKYSSISEYNANYSQQKNAELLTLDNYNMSYSDNMQIQKSTDHLSLNDATPEMLSSLSKVKTQTKNIILNLNGTKVGTIKLQYQTWVQGGRTQFAYDTCKLGHPQLNTYWTLESSNVSFSGDKISVYFSFIYGAFQDHAWVYFYP